MKHLRKTLPFLLIILLLLAACSAQETAVPAAESSTEPMADHDPAMNDNSGAMSGEMEDAGTMDGAQGSSMQEASGEPMSAMAPAPWQQIALTNATTGESFTLADFSGKTVFVEPMATWCTNCRQQQNNVREAKAQLGDEVVFVGLSLETNLGDGDLANYATGNGFDWTYAVMSEELLAQLADQFGRTITSAPSTPHFLILPDGSFTELSTGIHSAPEIIAQIQEANS